MREIQAGPIRREPLTKDAVFNVGLAGSSRAHFYLKWTLDTVHLWTPCCSLSPPCGHWENLTAPHHQLFPKWCRKNWFFFSEITVSISHLRQKLLIISLSWKVMANQRQKSLFLRILLNHGDLVVLSALGQLPELCVSWINKLLPFASTSLSWVSITCHQKSPTNTF